MINLSSIMQSAQGGQAIDNLSSRFGLSTEQTQSAVNALLPALQMGLQNNVESGGIGALLGGLGGAVHQQAYADPAAAQAPAVDAHGSSILGQLFGGSQSQVAQQVATESGVPASVIQSMLPVIASIIMGGLMHGTQGGAFGGILSGVLGSFFGNQAPGTTANTGTPAPDQGGGLGGMLGSVLGGLFGGGGSPDTAGTPAPSAPSSGSDTLSEISNMFKAGTSTSPDHEAQLANILGR